MKIVTTIVRLLLGLMFTVFGLNGFLQFLPVPPMTGYPAQFMTVIFATHFSVVIFLGQLIGGVLLLLNRFVPLGLTILAGILVNILAYHIFIARGALGMPLITTAMWFVVFYRVRASFAGIFAPIGTN
jgi:uncharacterized membrane protein YphA (DoxX/SURF4 family)